MLRCDAKDVAQAAQPDGLSPITARYIHTIIRAALRDAVRWNKVGRNIADSATPPDLGNPSHAHIDLDRTAGPQVPLVRARIQVPTRIGCSSKRRAVALAKRSACGGPTSTLRHAPRSSGTRSSRLTTRLSSRTYPRRSGPTSYGWTPAPFQWSSRGRPLRTPSGYWVVQAMPTMGWCSRWRMVDRSTQSGSAEFQRKQEQFNRANPD